MANPNPMQFASRAAIVAGEFCRGNAPLTATTFFVRSLNRSCIGQSGHGVNGDALLRRLGHNFELLHRPAASADDRAQAICARVAAADNDNALRSVATISPASASNASPSTAMILLWQELHGVVNAL